MKKIIVFLCVILAIILVWGVLLPSGCLRYSRVPDIKIVRDAQTGDRIMIDGKPFLVRGTCYSPVPIGKDYEYNFWGDDAKPWLEDGKLLRSMGGNTMRFYRLGKNPNEVKKVFDDLYYRRNIRFLCGHYLGFWSWPAPNYTDPEFREKIRGEVLEMVRLYKDHPGVLMWVLGNENNYSFDLNVQRWTSDEIDSLKDPEAQRREKARIYYTFVNDLAKDIKKIDKKHIVAMGVGEVTSLDLAKPVCPDIDALAMISYRGPGFGNLFRQIKQKFDIPVVMTEWGCDGFSAATQEPDEINQAQFLKLQWQDIERNASAKSGVGNCLGGTFFEWVDEWWKGNENLPHTWAVHDTAGHWQNSSYYFDAYGIDKMNMNEEWWGVIGQDPADSKRGYYRRVPKKSYFALKDLWTKKRIVRKRRYQSNSGG